MNIKKARQKAKDPRNVLLRERLAIADSMEQMARAIRLAQPGSGHRQAQLPVGLKRTN
jgi:hypothetical protein